MIINRYRVNADDGGRVGFWLMSDLHIGAANVDYDLIADEVRGAVDRGDRILINGDVFDAILPKDHRRYRPEVLHPHLQGRSDVLDAALEMAVELFRDARDHLDLVGLGNHESAVEKYHATDLVARFIRALGGTAKYGGYSGFASYQIWHHHHRRCSCVIYYHHGSGGNAPVTKGMIDFARKGSFVDSDVVWLGHKHNRIADGTPIRIRCPHQGDKPIYDPQVFVMTGGYMRPQSQTHEEVMRGGRKGFYAQDAGLPPQSPGGMGLSVEILWTPGKTRTYYKRIRFIG